LRGDGNRGFLLPGVLFCTAVFATIWFNAPWRGSPRNDMLTSAECRERAEQKITEAALHPRHEKRLRAAAEGWLILANVMQRAEASLQVAEPAE
jgi:hypothetical protein